MQLVTCLNASRFIASLRRRYGRRLSRTNFFLLTLVFTLVFIGGVVGLMAIFGTDVYERTFRESPGFARATVQLVSAPFFIIFTYLSVRRLHDFDRSGWWSLIFSVPTPWAFTDYIFTALLLALFLIPGTKGPNRYGSRGTGNRTEGVPTHDGKPPF